MMSKPARPARHTRDCCCGPCDRARIPAATRSRIERLKARRARIDDPAERIAAERIAFDNGKRDSEPLELHIIAAVEAAG